jgi:hypothetical protein
VEAKQGKEGEEEEVEGGVEAVVLFSLSRSNSSSNERQRELGWV